MKNRVYISTLIIIISSLSCSSTLKFSKNNKSTVVKEQESVNIPWDRKYKLTWDDFNGVVDSSQEYAAVTWTIIKRNQTGLSEDKIFMTINNFFLKEQSWVKRNQANDELLKHERIHWDIVEYFTRKLRKIYSEHLSSSINDSYIFFHNEYDKILNDKNDFQNQYDTETDFSKNKEKQKEWASKVEKLLKEYEDYSNINVEVNRIKEE